MKTSGRPAWRGRPAWLAALGWACWSTVASAQAPAPLKLPAAPPVVADPIPYYLPGITDASVMRTSGDEPAAAQPSPGAPAPPNPRPSQPAVGSGSLASPAAESPGQPLEQPMASPELSPVPTPLYEHPVGSAPTASATAPPRTMSLPAQPAPFATPPSQRAVTASPQPATPMATGPTPQGGKAHVHASAQAGPPARPSRHCESGGEALCGAGQVVGGAGQVLNGVGGMIKGTGRVVGAGFNAIGSCTKKLCDAGGGVFHGSHHAMQKVAKNLDEHGGHLSHGPTAPPEHDRPPVLLQEQRPATAAPQAQAPPSSQGS